MRRALPLTFACHLHLETKPSDPQRDFATKSPQHLVGVNTGIGGGSSVAYQVEKADSYQAGLTEKDLPT
jgi:hypothetical protein